MHIFHLSKPNRPEYQYCLRFLVSYVIIGTCYWLLLPSMTHGRVHISQSFGITAGLLTGSDPFTFKKEVFDTPVSLDPEGKRTLSSTKNGGINPDFTKQNTEARRDEHPTLGYTPETADGTPTSSDSTTEPQEWLQVAWIGAWCVHIMSYLCIPIVIAALFNVFIWEAEAYHERVLREVYTAAYKKMADQAANIELTEGVSDEMKNKLLRLFPHDENHEKETVDRFIQGLKNRR